MQQKKAEKAVKESQIHLMGGALLLVVLAAGYMFGIRPVLIANEQLEIAGAEFQRLQGQLPWMVRRNQELAADIAQQTEQIRGSYTIPAEGDQPILELVSSLLASRNLELQNFSEQMSAADKTATIEMQISGSYTDIVYLLSDLRVLQVPAMVSKFQITPNDQFAKQCNARLTVEFSESPSLPEKLATSSKSQGVDA